MTVVPVILGVDPGKNRLGLAVCTLEHGDPIWCGSADISEDGGGWMHQQVGRALGGVLVSASSRLRGYLLEPSILAMEDPTHAAKGKSQAREWGEVMATVEAEARRRWPHIETGGEWRLPIPTWKKTVGESGNCSKLQYVLRAIQLGYELPSLPQGVKPEVELVGGDMATLRPDHDAAAAACIATAGYRINAEAFEEAE